KIGMRHVADQVNTIFELLGHNLAFKSCPFRPLAYDPADKVETSVAKRGAPLEEKMMVLHAMQASHRKQTKSPVIRLDYAAEWAPGIHPIDSKTLHDDLLGRRARVVAKNVLPVEIGDGHTKLASPQLGPQQIRALQQIGTVQGEAETDSQQPRGR